MCPYHGRAARSKSPTNEKPFFPELESYMTKRNKKLLKPKKHNWQGKDLDILEPSLIELRNLNNKE